MNKSKTCSLSVLTNTARQLSSTMSWLVIAWMFAITVPTSAKAVTFCNPEYMPPGSCVPYDHMLERQKQREQMRYEQRTRIYTPEQWADFIRAAKMYDQRKKEEARKKLEKWDFHKSKPDESVKSCQAVFMSLRNGVMLIDMDGNTKGTFLGFFGIDIPRPTKPDQVRVSLTQSGATQSVKAYHLYLPWDGNYGAILFAVPSTKALIESIDDVQDYKVVMDGKTLVSGKWQGGLKARDWLQNCVDSR